MLFSCRLFCVHVGICSCAGACCVVGDVGNQLRETLVDGEFPLVRLWRKVDRICSSAGRCLPCVVMAAALSVDDDARCCFAIGGDTASDDPDVSGPIVSIVRCCGVPVISITAAAGVRTRAGRLLESDRLRFVDIVSKGACGFRGKPFG